MAAVDYLTDNGGGETGTLFSRGDCNADGIADISDAVAVLNLLFSNSTPVPCGRACDANDDGTVNIADPVNILAYLFGGADPLPSPFMNCGVDTTIDELDCLNFCPV